jgi:hypothetical protein
VETTQADLKAEIAHTQSLQNKNFKSQREPPGSALRSRPGQDTLVNDPKHGVTIRLYEDLTNLIVLSAKIQESQYTPLGEFEEITYKCVFSHLNTGKYCPFQCPRKSVLIHYRSKPLILTHVYASAQALPCLGPFAPST